MGGTWFTNRGQIVQTVAAIVSVCVAIVALYFVLKSNNSLPKASAVLYVSAAVFLVLVGVLIGRRAGQSAGQTQPQVIKKREVWFYSPGICVYFNRGANTIFVNLQMLSTERAELTYMRVDVRDTNKGTSITCESSEPMTVEKLLPAGKVIEQKITPQELQGFVAGSMVTLNGYAKFRDGDKITQSQFSITTIPSV